MEEFSTLNVCKNKLVLDGLECKLRSVYAADFTKQMSTIQEVIETIWELELKQAPAEVTELLSDSDHTCFL